MNSDEEEFGVFASVSHSSEIKEAEEIDCLAAAVDQDFLEDFEDINAQFSVSLSENNGALLRAEFDYNNEVNSNVKIIKDEESEFEKKLYLEETEFENETEDITFIEDINLLPQKGIHSVWTALPILPVIESEEVYVIQFAAKGPQDIVAGFSSEKKAMNPMYELRIGDEGNLKTVLRKKMHEMPVAMSYSMICSKGNFTPYWVIVIPGKGIFMGIGTEPGTCTVLSYLEEESTIEELRVFPKYVSFTCLEHATNFKDIKMFTAKRESFTIEEPLLPFRRVPGSDEGISVEEQALLEEGLKKFETECSLRKKRAIKFGGVYVQPNLESYVPWSMLKRLSSNPKMLGGLDRTTQVEREKAIKRAERFDLPIPEMQKLFVNVDPGLVDSVTEDKRNERKKRFGIEFDQYFSEALKEQCLKVEDVIRIDYDRTDPLLSDQGIANIVKDKIHVFCLDKHVCKEIRNSDVKSYFSDHGACYIEWINDWSFNVVFHSSTDAEKALQNCSIPIPSNALLSNQGEILGEGGAYSPEEGEMVFEEGEVHPKVPEFVASSSPQRDIIIDEREVPQRVFEFVASSNPQEEIFLNGKMVPDKEENPTKVPDLGTMGWRLGQVLTKVKTDKFGLQGQWVRILLRKATLKDILIKKPIETLLPTGSVPDRKKVPLILKPLLSKGNNKRISHQDEALSANAEEPLVKRKGRGFLELEKKNNRKKRRV